MCFHLYEIFKKDKSIETESRFVFGRGRGGEGKGSDCLMVWDLLWASKNVFDLHKGNSCTIS